MVLLYSHCPLMGPQTGGYPDFPNSFGRGILRSSDSGSCIVRAYRAGFCHSTPARSILVNTTCCGVG